MGRSSGLRVLLASLGVMAATGGSVWADELKVVATIKPIHSIAAAVLDGVVVPRLLIDGAGSPHTFTLKPSDAKAVNQASYFVRVSESLEPFTGKLVKALPVSVKVITLEAAPGLVLHKLRAGAEFESHSDGKGGHGHGHAHGKKAGTAAETDGHIWLDPGNAKVIAKYLAETFASAMPQHADRMRSNAMTFAAATDGLTAELTGILQPLAGRPYLVFHDAYQYFERRFGLAPVGSVTVSPDVPPSAKRLTELRRKVETLKAACVFAEPQFAPRIIETIIEKTSARKGVLDPLGAALPAGKEQYPALLRALASDLKACLAAPA